MVITLPTPPVLKEEKQKGKIFLLSTQRNLKRLTGRAFPEYNLDCGANKRNKQKIYETNSLKTKGDHKGRGGKTH